METTQFLTSACRYCRYYQPEGRRGGMCQQLGAPVQSSWKACGLALPPFAASWKNLEEILKLPDATPVLASSQPVTSALESAALAPADQDSATSTPEQIKAGAVLV